MAEILLITPEEITSTTPLGGNVDFDKYLYVINDTQEMYIQPIIGEELYDYILINRNSLTGDYAIILNKYIKKILKFLVVSFMYQNIIIDNAGAYIPQLDNKTTPNEIKESSLAQNYRAKADFWIIQLNKFLCNKNIPEYNYNNENINPNKNLRTITGWHI